MKYDPERCATQLLRDFVKEVQAMRDAQRLYFTTRKPHDLMEAKRLEREVDELADQLVGGASLFDQTGES